MPTMTGFRHAPVSKGLIFATAGASILSQAARASRRTQLVPAALTHGLVFRSPAELLFGTLVLYYFRLLERESGPSKFGAFAAVSASLAAALQWAAQRSGLGLPPCPSGPYGLIFACFVQYYFQVPASNKMVVLGWRLSDKVFMYLLGVQLLLSAGRASLLAGGTGLVAGLLYRFNVLGIKRLRFPAVIRRLFANTFGALLGSSDAPSAAPAPAARAAAGTGPAAAGPRRGGGGAAAAAGGGGDGGGAAAASAPHLPAPSSEAVEQLVAMGFGESESVRALQLTNNDLQQAIGLLLNA
ncbi:hypothetical protein PLESTB_000771900 [Pleodorina starrii]|uniref:UBA domain-containing protein n=1 Tax=Pleodorina starrii TaxID=330485 RepID=A0A9W6BKF7_9CHLO|nr:hypothetical protein PLESTM_000433400 [Pleodorina starrii]GLC53643.1 hypothetical protein PLESTB_000771900 [Pleodorina starrii]GLC65660.1 hypothetical protein PLESTF_000326300 [Pleodorina starrii]